MFYIHNHEVVEVEVLAKNTSDYHNDTFTYYDIKCNGEVKLNVSSSNMYDSGVQAAQVLEGILERNITSKKVEVEILEGKLSKLKGEV